MSIRQGGKLLNSKLTMEGSSIALTSFLKKNGIHYQQLCPHAHQQMKVVERRHQHVVDIGITLLHHANLPQSYLNFAFFIAPFLYNCTSMKCLNGDSPFECLFGQSLNLTDLKAFGYMVFPNLRTIQTNKFSTRSSPHIFIGYPNNACGYLCLNSENGKIIIFRDVSFIEDNFDLGRRLFKNQGQSSQRQTIIPLDSVMLDDSWQQQKDESGTPH